MNRASAETKITFYRSSFSMLMLIGFNNTSAACTALNLLSAESSYCVIPIITFAIHTLRKDHFTVVIVSPINCYL